MKQIIDKHIIEYHRYYSCVCINYYKGRYLWEDLLQELYLEFLNCNENTIAKFNEQKKLHFLGAKIIQGLYSKRGKRKEYKVGTSNLNELSNLKEYSNLKTIQDETDPFAYIDDEEVKRAMDDLYKRDWFLHDVLVITQSESINNLSKRTKIDRGYLTKAIKEAKYYIKNHEQITSI